MDKKKNLNRFTAVLDYCVQAIYYAESCLFDSPYLFRMPTTNKILRTIKKKKTTLYL